MSTTMLYRPAEAPNEAVWGRCVDYAVFPDADVPQALTDGWYRHPDDIEHAQPAEPSAADPEAPVPKRKGRPPKAEA